MLSGPGGLDEFFSPGDWFVVLGPWANERCIERNRSHWCRGRRCQRPFHAQIGEFNGKPGIGFALSGLSQGECFGLCVWREVSGECRFGPRWPSRWRQVSSANSRIVSSIENRVRRDDRSATSSDLRTKASSRSMTAKSPGSSDPVTAQALSRSKPPAKHRTPLQQGLFGVIE